MVVQGMTYVAGAAARPASVAEARNRYGRVVLAQLVADPTNPHHSGAVGVWIGDAHVGYVRRDVLAVNGARTLRRMLEQEAPVTVWGHIETVPDKRGDYLGVTLHHELTTGASKNWAFDVTVPPLGYAKVIGAEARATELLERMRTSKATDTANPTRPQLVIPATLSLTSDAAIGVQVDGTSIGSLSAQESARRVAVVQQVLDAGRGPIAELRLRTDAAYSKLTASLLCMVDD